MTLRLARFLNLAAVLTLTAFAAVSVSAQDPIDPTTFGACANTTDPCVPTYHNDKARDGVQPNEILLNSTLFGMTPNFGFLGSNATMTSTTVDGLIYAQPLYLTGVTMKTSACNNVTKNIVIVASENNWIYAFAVDNSTPGSFSMTTCWAKSLNGSNQYGSEYSIPFTALPPTGGSGLTCNNVVPESGITSTPVIDTQSNPPVLYVVTAHQVPTAGNPTFTYRLHAIRVSNGVEALSGNGPFDLVQAINATNPTYPFKAQQQNQRVGLAMYRTRTSSGALAANIYVGFGSFCDANITSQDQYSGYMAAVQFVYTTQTFSSVGVFTTQGSPSSGSDGGIWMGGGAPVLDANNNLYFGVGNGGWNGTTTSRPTNLGQSMVKLVQNSAPSLTAVDFYTPNDWSTLDNTNGSQSLCVTNNPPNGSCPSADVITPNAGDLDVGSGGVTLLAPLGITNPLCPSSQELIAGGKEGVFYGTCYSTSTSSSPQSTMGGLDGCGYLCNQPSNEAVTACTYPGTGQSLPTPGAIAQCFPAVNVTNTINGSGPAPGSRATAAFWAGNSANFENYLYIAGSGDSLRGYQIQGNQFNTQGAAGSRPTTYAYPGASPALSWDNSSPSNALLWVVDPVRTGSWNGKQNQTVSAMDALLDVYNPIPQGTAINRFWSSTSGNGPGAVKYAVPTIANGMVFIAGGAANYAPGPQGATGVNCSPAASGGSAPTCQGLLVVYGKLTP